MTEKRILTDDEQALSRQVAEVCGLELPTPTHYLTDDGHSPHILKELEELGVDALGCCNRDTGDIVLFVERCRQAANELKANPRHIELIVLVHEWAHLIQHWGHLPDAPVVWQDFPRLPQGSGTDKEDLAQKAAFMALHGFADGKALQRTMVLMADCQPAPYRKFLNDFAIWLESGEPPNETLLELRRLLRVVRDAKPDDVIALFPAFDA